jgi:hypothetical protein
VLHEPNSSKARPGRLRMADLGASGEIRATLVDRAADAIVAEPTGWEADLIVLGTPRCGNGQEWPAPCRREAARRSPVLNSAARLLVSWAPRCS